MPIKVIPINNRFSLSNDKTDCIVLRWFDENPMFVEVSFPFHEDTPNFHLAINEAMDLKNAIDQLLDIKLIEKPRGQ